MSSQMIPAGADFGIYVGGDSMESIYHDGQLVWVQKCSEILPGAGRHLPVR